MLQYLKVVFSLRASSFKAHCSCENIPSAHSLEVGYFSQKKNPITFSQCTQEILPGSLWPPWSFQPPWAARPAEALQKTPPELPQSLLIHGFSSLFPILLEGQGRARCSQPCWVIRTDTDTWACLILPRFSEFPQHCSGTALGTAQLTWTGFGRAADKWDLPGRWDLCPLPVLLPWAHLNPGSCWS